MVQPAVNSEKRLKTGIFAVTGNALGVLRVPRLLIIFQSFAKILSRMALSRIRENPAAVTLGASFLSHAGFFC